MLTQYTEHSLLDFRLTSTARNTHSLIICYFSLFLYTHLTWNETGGATDQSQWKAPDSRKRKRKEDHTWVIASQNEKGTVGDATRDPIGTETRWRAKGVIDVHQHECESEMRQLDCEYRDPELESSHQNSSGDQKKRRTQTIRLSRKKNWYSMIFRTIDFRCFLCVKEHLCI